MNSSTAFFLGFVAGAALVCLIVANSEQEQIPQDSYAKRMAYNAVGQFAFGIGYGIGNGVAQLT